MEQPNYYAVIPANVRYDKDLTANAKLLYGEITALAQKNGACFATNKYFSELYNLSERAISRLICSLKDKNYIKIEFDNSELNKKHRQICLGGVDKIGNDTLDKIVQCNNTSNINNTSITKENKKESFEKFWNEYPKKKSKGTAEKWFDKNKPSDELVEFMISKLRLLKNSSEWKKNNGQYIPYPATWLNSKGWEDEVTGTSDSVTQNEPLPKWLDKKTEGKDMTAEESAEWENLVNSF